jgi:hypothetical protein
LSKCRGARNVQQLCFQVCWELIFCVEVRAHFFNVPSMLSCKGILQYTEGALQVFSILRGQGYDDSGDIALEGLQGLGQTDT